MKKNKSKRRVADYLMLTVLTLALCAGGLMNTGCLLAYLAAIFTTKAGQYTVEDKEDRANHGGIGFSPGNTSATITLDAEVYVSKDKKVPVTWALSSQPLYTIVTQVAPNRFTIAPRGNFEFYEAIIFVGTYTNSHGEVKRYDTDVRVSCDSCPMQSQ